MAGDTFGPIEAVYKQMYDDNVKLQIQVKSNIFEQAFMYAPNLKGREAQVLEMVGREEADLNYPESAPSPNKPSSHEGVYVQPQRITWGKTIPKSTTIKAAVDYTSPYMQTGANAVTRARAKLMRDALFGARLMRQDNTGAIAAVTFDTTNQLVALAYQYGGGGSNSGLTVQKFIKAVEKLGFNDLDVDVEDIHCAMTMKQNTDLYQAIQLTNDQYVGRYQLNDKIVRTFLGVKIHIWNNLTIQTASDGTNLTRRIPMWAKSGMYYGDFSPVETNLERAASMQYQPYGFIENWFGATRGEDEKVVAIDCLEPVA